MGQFWLWHSVPNGRQSYETCRIPIGTRDEVLGQCFFRSTTQVILKFIPRVNLYIENENVRLYISLMEQNFIVLPQRHRMSWFGSQLCAEMSPQGRWYHGELSQTVWWDPCHQWCAGSFDLVLELILDPGMKSAPCLQPGPGLSFLIKVHLNSHNYLLNQPFEVFHFERIVPDVLQPLHWNTEDGACGCKQKFGPHWDVAFDNESCELHLGAMNAKWLVSRNSLRKPCWALQWIWSTTFKGT